MKAVKFFSVLGFVIGVNQSFAVQYGKVSCSSNIADGQRIQVEVFFTVAENFSNSKLEVTGNTFLTNGEPVKANIVVESIVYNPLVNNDKNLDFSIAYNGQLGYIKFTSDKLSRPEYLEEYTLYKGVFTYGASVVKNSMCSVAIQTTKFE